MIRNEGLVSATVIKAGTAGVTVRPDAGDRTPIRYSAADVYFLVAGELTTAKKLQNYLQPGSESKAASDTPASQFPRSKFVGDRTLWLEHEVDAWIDALPNRQLKGDTEAAS